MCKGEMPEWLKEQFAKLSTGNCRQGSNPCLSAFCVQWSIYEVIFEVLPIDKLGINHTTKSYFFRGVA